MTDAQRTSFDAAWDELFASIRRARGRAMAEMEKEGLSLAQYQLLSAFASAGAETRLSVGALAEGADVAQPTATRMLDGLERAGIVERRPSDTDRRRVTVELTPRGRQLVRRKQKQVERKRERVYESLSQVDRRRAADLMRAIAAAIEER